MKFKGLTIGIPKEIMTGENRVAATPETVRKLVAEGARVIIQHSAGVGAFFEDDEYKNAGAIIERDVEKLFSDADIIMKVKEPMFNEERGKHEVDMMHEGQLLVAFLHPANPMNHEMVKNLAKKKIISLSLDSIPRISRAQPMDALTSMSTVAGYKAVISASTMLPKFIPMVGTAVGMIQPAKIFVIGAGVAGLQALATAKRLGAATYAADVRPEAVEQAKSLGAKIIDTGIDPKDAIGPGGYAKHLPEELLEKERNSFKEIIREVDVVILSALVPGKLAPILVTEEMVKSMQHGSIIEDISIDQGGNCALTVPGKVVKRYDVTINGTKNIPGSVPVTATHMFSKNILNFVFILVKDGKINLDLNDEIIRSALVTIDGEVVHEGTLEAMRECVEVKK
ncbi:MAG: NAD(P) transhydrogenase subunit alpha [Spirochaetes bacterium]|nr:NAD(P) transhydrogenase subunit alpha [Spirochaetota bacterium]